MAGNQAERQMLRFNPSPRDFTVGMEIELQLINSATGDLEQRSQDIFAQLPASLHPQVKPELMRSVVEIISNIHESVDGLAEDMRSKLETVLAIAEQQGLSFAGGGTHPFAHWYDQEITADQRYYRLLEQMQGIGRRLLTFGLHVHIGLDHPEKAIAIFNALIGYIPYFLGLSCNSPFWGREKVGIHSTRSKIFERLPMGGLPLPLANWSEYVWLMETLRTNGVIESERDIHWDLRPHPAYGTLELRVCDTPSRFDEMLLIAALVQTIVADLVGRYEAGERLPVPHPLLVRTNKWHTARYGLEAEVTAHDGSKAPLVETLTALLERLKPAAQNLGTQNHLNTFYQLVKMGTGSQRQLEVYDRARDLVAVVRDLNQQLKSSLQRP